MSVEYAWHDLMGNLGVLLIVGSYFQLQINRISSSSPVYSLVNASGAALVLVSLSYDFNLSAALVESFWLLISLMGLFLRIRNKNPVVEDAVAPESLPETHPEADS